MQKTSFFRKLTARPSIFIVLAGLLVMAVAAPAAGAHHKADHVGNPKQATAESLSIPLDDLYAEATEPGAQGEGTFDGFFHITEFKRVGETLYAVGTVDGVFEYADGATEGISEEGVEIPVTTDGNNNNGVGTLQQDGDGVCPILFLELGPVFLDVLGLVIEIPEPIQLDIYAERGPGNLLGNLLCSIVGLLDDPVDDGVLSRVDRLIDNVNRLLERILG